MKLWHDTFICMYFRDACIHTCDIMVYIYINAYDVTQALAHCCVQYDSTTCVRWYEFTFMYSIIFYPRIFLLVERERTQSFLCIYIHTHVCLERDWISGMTHSITCIFVKYAFICVTWCFMFVFIFMVGYIYYLILVRDRTLSHAWHWIIHLCQIAQIRTSKYYSVYINWCIFISISLLCWTHTHVCLYVSLSPIRIYVYTERTYTFGVMGVPAHTCISRERRNLWNDKFICMYFRDACIHTCDMMQVLAHFCV